MLTSVDLNTDQPDILLQNSEDEDKINTLHIFCSLQTLVIK